ncbi:hypothetical protein NMY22_g13480 [Coprinellus aureogranulatus]|nr:hypothetical protein NMY22_g13480 [Coprinellus aureogranulatus]
MPHFTVVSGITHFCSFARISAVSALGPLAEAASESKNLEIPNACRGKYPVCTSRMTLVDDKADFSALSSFSIEVSDLHSQTSRTGCPRAKIARRSRRSCSYPKDREMLKIPGYLAHSLAHAYGMLALARMVQKETISSEDGVWARGDPSPLGMGEVSFLGSSRPKKLGNFDKVHAEPLLGFAFIQTFVDIFEEYFGGVSLAAVKENFDVVYQLLEETLDSVGHPLTTSHNALRDIVLPPSLLSKLINAALTSNLAAIGGHAPNHGPAVGPFSLQYHGGKLASSMPAMNCISTLRRNCALL